MTSISLIFIFMMWNCSGINLCNVIWGLNGAVSSLCVVGMLKHDEHRTSVDWSDDGDDEQSSNMKVRIYQGT